MKFKFLLFNILFFSAFISARASTFYVSNSGDDANSGTSPAQAWRTTVRVSAATFHPGDRVLFAGGQTFNGNIQVRGSTQGTSAEPIVFRSYGKTPAVIASGIDYGFYAHNAAGIELRNLTFTGSSRLTNQNSGVRFYNDSTNAHLNYLRVDSLDVSGYQQSGLIIGSNNGESGYADVRVTNCQLHDNGESGLTSFAKFPLIGHRNWYVGNVNAYDNAGRADVPDAATGNGIVLSGIDGAVIEHCTAHHNGRLNRRGGGPAGIWGWDCNNLTIQFCESHHNEAGGQRDGGGFDLDGGCTNSVMQYNYSHDNDGPGYLLVQFDYARPMHDLIVRYNISQNDGRQQEQGAILLYSSGWAGGIVNADIYNNTLLLDQPANGTRPPAIYLLSGDVSGITVRNNILQTATNLPAVRTFTTSGVRFEGNSYWSPDGALTLNWNGSIYGSLAAWRADTGQETLDNGTRLTGMTANAVFASTGPGVPPFTLDASSPLLGQGLNLAKEFNLDPGTRDIYGNPTPDAGSQGNIGASEFRTDKTPPLPVELVRFTAEPMGADAVLRWATASEKNNDRFEVEASADGHTFRRIGQVAGHGNSSQAHDYQLVDPAIARYAAALVYYRLRQVDRDGTASYSPVQTVAINQLAKLSLYPNPATGTASLTGVRPGQKVTVTDAVGRQVLAATADVTGTAALVLPRGLAAGVYLVRVGTSALRLNVE